MQGIWLGDELYEFLKREAIHYIVYYKMQYPLNSFEFAQKLGFITKSYDQLDEFQKNSAYKISYDAFFIDNHQNTFIFYNNQVFFERKNVSIIHEISHAILDHGQNKCNNEKEEAEANFFTKYIIAPPPLIHQFPLISVKSIKNNFEISYEFAENALYYYQKWLKKFNGVYKNYETMLLNHCGFRNIFNKGALI